MASAATRARTATKKSKTKTKPKAAAAAPLISRTRKPDALAAIEWQRTLRRQFGREQNFTFKNLGAEPVFSEFSVVNPAGGKYRVAIRGGAPGDNFCGCADFATNRLGTCKHVEFMLATLAAKRGGKAALATGFAPSFSEIYVQYGQQRSLRVRVGADCPASLRRYFESLIEPVTGELPMSAIGAVDPMMKAAQHVAHWLRPTPKPSNRLRSSRC